MKKVYIYGVFVVLLAGTACTDLDEKLQDRYTKKIVPSNPGVGNKNNVNKATPNDGLAGAFSAVLSGTATNGGFFAVQEGGTDEAVIAQKGGDWYDGGLYIKMHHHEYNPQTWAINDCWTQAYTGIFQANTILAEAGTTTAQKAQLRTLRAYFYWRLMDVFGNVKIVTVAGTDAAQANRQTVYNFIVSELQAALPDLPPGKQEYGRVSQGAAYALLARIYLNSQVYVGTPKWQEAIDAADMVINSGVYNLSPDYAKVFSPDNVENEEHIFVATFDEATGQGNTFAQMTLHYPSQLTYKLQSQPWNGFATLEDFYKSYEDVDARKAANFITGKQYDRFGNQLLDLAYDKADEDGPGLDYTPFINELSPNSSRQAGARFGKFAFKIGQHDNMDNDYPLLRLGEVILNKAEALCRKNGFGDATALTLVNQIRARAGATPFVSMTEGQLLAERGRELFVESLRRTDLIRFGAYGNPWWEHTADVDPTHHLYLMPIPLEQMQAAAIAAFPLVQNPGY